MAVLSADSGLQVDYSDDGAGAPMVLVHSSSIGNRQWRRLIEMLAPQRRLLAVNLFGYGKTTPWHQDGTQRFADQAGIVRVVLDRIDGPVDLVGHSFGGAVVMKAASLWGERIRKMALIEPNPFPLLREAGRLEAWAEACAVRDAVKTLGARGEWEALAERFANYWNGDGAWAALPPDKREAFALALRPNYFEWDTIDNEDVPVSRWQQPEQTMLICSPKTRRAIVELCEVLTELHPRWRIERLPEGGHMAPLTHSHLVNPLVSAFLRD